MKTIKVAEATELQLDWLVARIEGDELPKSGGKGLGYSSDWAVGGPIIEREVDTIERRVGYFYVNRFKRHKDRVNPDFSTTPGDRNAWATGPTMLIAGLRCYVASKLGDTAEVPGELV